MIYILDTNIVSFIIKNRDFSLIDTFEKISEKNRIGISTITVAELFYGVEKKGSPKLEVAVREFLSPLEKYSFDENAAFIYGKIRSELEASGKIIGSHDMLIAAHALSMDATLVTNNTREFTRVKNLSIEDWTTY
ncbi:MAG TPA: type II toxin-antitoxin system VapC family toxin [Arcobacter sp.]|nr:type II toxin-antitoxin system VapC family toxin [Arcobacter sp.]